jgi:hypothetical protein
MTGEMLPWSFESRGTDTTGIHTPDPTGHAGHLPNICVHLNYVLLPPFREHYGILSILKSTPIEFGRNKDARDEWIWYKKVLYVF